ncbi:MAG: hypothetical protein ACHQ0J_04005 [Candidatus Dormibacterales bacterium]
MRFSSAISRRVAPRLGRYMRLAAAGALLAGSLSVAGGAPPAAAVVITDTIVGTSTHAMAYQHSAADKVAYLYDGSLLVGYFDGTQVIIKHVTSPETSPLVTQVDTVANGSEVSFYVLSGVSSSEIWEVVGNELYGGVLREQIVYATYNGTFSFGAPHSIPGAMTNGRQDPTVTWNGKDLIASWWDDTLGGNSDSVFMNWTTDKTGATGWLSKYGTTSAFVAAKNGVTAAATTVAGAKSGTTAAATIAGATSISYTLVSGAAPAIGDVMEFGAGTVNDEVRTVSGVAGATPYVLTVAALTNAHAMGENDTTGTTITYNNSGHMGGAPVAGDSFIFGSGTANSETRTVAAVDGAGPVYNVAVTAAFSNNHLLNEPDTLATWMITYAAVTGGAPLVADMYQFGNSAANYEFRALTAVTGTGPYTLSFAGLVNTHATSEVDTQESDIEFYSPVASNIAQVALRHSAKLGATIVVYGARNHLYSRTLLDSKADPSLVNWTGENTIDGGYDDSEASFGGPQIAIDEATGNLHVFRAVTNAGGPAYDGVNYWLGRPDATPMVTGGITWSSRLTIDTSTVSATDPPDIAGAVDTLGRVYVFWTTTAVAGAIKYVTLVSPYTSFSSAVTVATTGTQPRYPHVPALAPLSGGIVPLVYQSGTGSPYSIYLNTSVSTTTACNGTPLSTSFFSWYDKASPGMYNDNIHLVNPGLTTSTGCVRLGGLSIPFSLTAGQESFATFPAGTIGGPVVVTVVAGPAVLASQRVQYYQTFNEVWAQSAAQAATTSYINWYDKASPGMYNDNIHILNPGTLSADVTVSLPSTPSQMVTGLAPGAEAYVSFPGGTIGGPVTITSTHPVLASQRVQYYSSFNEVWAENASQAGTTSYSNWYDKASPGMYNDNIHLLNPGGSTAHVTVSLPGAPDQLATVLSGGEGYVSFPGGSIAGPVTVTSDHPILSSQRVQYYSSFNEVWTEGAAQAATTSYINWYDKASPGMYNDNIHLLNTSGSTANVTVSLTGSPSQLLSVPAGAEAYVSFPPGSIGGPVTITSNVAILAAQRVQYYSSFNEIWAA